MSPSRSERRLRAALVAGMTPEERQLMDGIVEVYDGVRALGLRRNEAEFTHAVHTLQMFVINRVLHRQWPDYWSSWFYRRRLSPGRMATPARTRRQRRAQLLRRPGRRAGMAACAAGALCVALFGLRVTHGRSSPDRNA